MRRLGLGQAPASLQAAAITSDFGELARDGNLRQALYDAQKGLCAYCERRLGEHTKIEHFHPRTGAAPWTQSCRAQSGAPTQDRSRTAWRNLILCCPGGERGSGDRTCDTAKADRDICSTFENPKGSSRPWLALPDRGGKLIAVASLPSGAQSVIDDVLRLNTKSLVDARREQYLALIRNAVGRRSQREDRNHDLKRRMAARVRQRGQDEAVAFPAVFELVARELER